MPMRLGLLQNEHQYRSNGDISVTVHFLFLQQTSNYPEIQIRISLQCPFRRWKNICPVGARSGNRDPGQRRASSWTFIRFWDTGWFECWAGRSASKKRMQPYGSIPSRAASTNRRWPSNTSQVAVKGTLHRGTAGDWTRQSVELAVHDGAGRAWNWGGNREATTSARWLQRKRAAVPRFWWWNCHPHTKTPQAKQKNCCKVSCTGKYVSTLCTLKSKWCASSSCRFWIMGFSVFHTELQPVCWRPPPTVKITQLRKERKCKKKLLRVSLTNPNPG